MTALASTATRTITVATSSSGSDPLRLVEVAARPLGGRDVRVRVRAIGVNPVDWKMRSGGPLRFAHRFVGPPGPLVVGVDFAGEVVESGPHADLAPGARVVGGTDFSRGQLGSYATEVVVRDDQCATLPEDTSFEAAACLPVPGATALRAFRAHGPFDLVLHAVGTATYPLPRCRALLSPRGLIALAVVRVADVPSILFRRTVKSVLGRPGRSNLEPLVAALARGEIETLIEARLPLEEAEKAHELSRAGKVVGKLLLVPS